VQIKPINVAWEATIMSWDALANCWERVLVSIGVFWERLLVSVGGYWHAAVDHLPDAAFWEKASKFAPVVTASIAALAAFFAWLSIRAQRDTARRRAAIDFFLKTDVDEKTIDLYTKFKRAVRGLEARTSFDDFVGEQEYQDLRAFLNICELIAVGIKQKAFSDSVSFAYWGDVLPRSYRDAEVLIKYIRNAPREGTPHTYVDLERLCKKWSKRGAWRRRLALLIGGRFIASAPAGT
jgi:hypothetical protein